MVMVGGQVVYLDGFGFKFGVVEYCVYNDLVVFEVLIFDNICVVMMEFLQGEGGIILFDLVFVKGVCELCDKYNVLLIFDEV